MAYNPKDLEIKALEAIEKNKLFFIDDVCAYLPCTRATFYNLELDKLKIKNLINLINLINIY